MTVKQQGTKNEKYKAELMVLGHKDMDKLLTTHTSFTVRYESIRILLTLYASPWLKVWNQDVIKAYIQQGYNLQTEICIKPVDQFKLGIRISLKTF